ncbi:MAG: glutamate racemase [Burkholderiales bacterium]|nr:glutamate racemase [Burkholderiales bacterium]
MKFDRFSPIGIFDSGVGGLSVLQHIRQTLPHEALLYFADSGFAPYGDKAESVIIERSLAVADYLIAHHIKALVVACNTATAAAIKVLRQRYPDLILIGMEPGLKPAALHSHSKIVGVLATQATVLSEKFLLLRAQLETARGVQFIPQACTGLVDQIEKGELASAATLALVRRYVAPLLAQGADTLVLGCTHYPFVAHLIRQVCADCGQPNTQLIDTGAAVALHLQRLLTQAQLLRPAITPAPPPSLRATTTGSASSLQQALLRLLKIGDCEVLALAAVA